MVNFTVVSPEGDSMEVPETHAHEWTPCVRQLHDLTTPQLRKLVFYRGDVGKCTFCGAVVLDDGRVISRNGNPMS
jgi:hypothetical protein